MPDWLLPVVALPAVVGVPGWPLLLGVPAWLAVVLLLATGAVKWSFAIFLGVLLSAAIGTSWLAVEVAKSKDALRGARAAVVIVLSAAVPVVFDPHTGDVFNLPKYTLTIIGALVLIGLWVVAVVQDRAVPRWRNGLQWLVGAVVAWTAISAFAGVDVHVGLLGNYGSYDGFYSAAAFGVIMMTAAEAFDARDIRKALGAVGFAGGSVIVVYGLVQLHDTEVHGSTWDFIHWNLGSFSQQIFATFGNPNHLGGYLAMIFPIVLVIGITAKHVQWRILSGLFGLAVLTELLRTAARGAWLGVIAAGVVLAIALAPELRRRAVVTAGVAGALLVIAVVAVAAFGHRFLAQPLSSFFETGGTSSVQQRLEIWKTAWHIALNHPLTGVGPDNFANVWPHYQSASWVAGFGPNYLVNGAHDIFMNVLADQGFIGLALFLALLLYIGLRAIGGWRRLRSLERSETIGPEVKERAQAYRLCLAAASASMVAYIVQAVFNVQQVGLTIVFWLTVGSATVLSQAAWVPDTLRPRALVSAVPAEEALNDEVLPAARPVRPAPAWGPRAAGRRKRPSTGRRPDTVPWWTLGVGAVAAVVVVFLALGADGPLRADHDYWAAYSSLKQPTATSGGSSATAATQVGSTYFSDLKSSFALNPWEPTYPADEANVLSSAAAHVTSSSSALSDLLQAHALAVKATAEKPLWAPYPASEAEVDVDLSEVQPANAQTDLAQAVSMARMALKDNPRDSGYQSLLSEVLAKQRSASKK